MAGYDFINTVVWFDFIVSSIQKSRKRELSSFTDKTMVNFCKGCDVNMFLLKKL